MTLCRLRDMFQIYSQIPVHQGLIPVGLILIGLQGVAFAAPSAPSVDQALTLEPIQTGVQYDKPTRSEAKSCSIKPERVGKSTSWVIRDGQGQVLRKFADTNADNVVDTWSYYANGLEVYRDADTDFDSKADQYRWFHMQGSRWGVDQNEDGKIDYWKQISPQEVAEEAVAALQNKDSQRFALLLIRKSEADKLGLGKTLAMQINEQMKLAPREFSQLSSKQKTITSKSRFVDFGSSRPGVVPAGVDGSTEDVMIYENASALLDNGGAPEQLLLGSLIKVGEAWRLIETPKLGDSSPKLANVFSVSSQSVGNSSGQPSQASQDLMAELEKLDQQSGGGVGSTASIERRIAILEKLATTASTKVEQKQWYIQLADLLSAVAQSEGYEKGLTKLQQLESSPSVRAVGSEMASHLRYRRIGAIYGYGLRDPKADYAKLQTQWVKNLEAFVDEFPRSQDTPDAMLQLGMAQEFAGEIDKAKGWYDQLWKEFPSSQSGKKANGAIRRLSSVGKALGLKGKTLDGATIDLSRAPYRGKHVVVHYWATWCEPCKEDMAKLEAMQRKYGSKLAVLGVNLDNSASEAKAFLASKRFSSKHLYDEQGLEGDRANELGVMTLPLMLLVDDSGKVANRNLNGSELETELQRLIR